MSAIDVASPAQLPLRRVHGETALFVLSLVIGALMWAALLFVAVRAFPTSILVVVYIIIIAAIYFGARVAFITSIRGNGARLGPEQFPELYERVQILAGRMGMKRLPAAYLMQAGGALNAIATRFIRTSMVVFYTDLIEACGDNGAARDMIIGHELAHIRAGHLRLRWLVFPSLIIPFLGTALARAREYTCDCAGLAAAGERDGALLGLSILAVGAKFGPSVRHEKLVAQRRDLNTGWMTLGQWFMTHPPLSKRIAALDPGLSTETRSGVGGTLRGLAIILAFVLIVAGGAFLGVRGTASRLGGLFSHGLDGSADQSLSEAGSSFTPSTTAAEDLNAAFAAVGAVLDNVVASGGTLPESYEELLTLWSSKKGNELIPTDPFDGQELGYDRTDTGYRLWSSGPDGVAQTDDDITYDGPRN